MSDSSRRGFLRGVGLGVAGVGAAAVVGRAGTADAAIPDTETALPPSAADSVVAHVTNVRSGEMTLMVEGHEVAITDRALAARIANALHDNSPHAASSRAV